MNKLTIPIAFTVITTGICTCVNANELYFGVQLTGLQQKYELSGKTDQVTSRKAGTKNITSMGPGFYGGYLADVGHGFLVGSEIGVNFSSGKASLYAKDFERFSYDVTMRRKLSINPAFIIKYNLTDRVSPCCKLGLDSARYEFSSISSSRRRERLHKRKITLTRFESSVGLEGKVTDAFSVRAEISRSFGKGKPIMHDDHRFQVRTIGRIGPTHCVRFGLSYKI